MRPMSEILASALELLGPNGEHWTQGRLGNNFVSREKGLDNSDKVCTYGAIYKDMCAHGELELTNVVAVSQLAVKVEHCLASEGRTIVDINDSAPNFSVVKQMFCDGIKKALAAEDTTNETTQ